MPFFKACNKLLKLAAAIKCEVRTHQEFQNRLDKLMDKRCKPDPIGKAVIFPLTPEI